MHFELSGPPEPCFMMTLTVDEVCGPCWLFVGPQHMRFMFSESLSRKVEKLPQAARDDLMQRLQAAAPGLVEQAADSTLDAASSFAEAAPEGWSEVDKR